MPKGSPRATAIQAALQGFSGTFFPIAKQQIDLQQEIGIKQTIQQQELANALQLAQEKSNLETQQEQSRIGSALEMGFEPESLGPSGFTFKPKKPGLTKEALKPLLPEELIPEVEKMHPDLQQKYIDDYRANQGLILRNEAQKSAEERNRLILEIRSEQNEAARNEKLIKLEKNLADAKKRVPFLRGISDLFGQEEAQAVERIEQEMEALRGASKAKPTLGGKSDKINRAKELLGKK